jgi:peptidoglycan/xylan/chitin deacetylase (PgdA/CDA1 family)
VTRLRTLTGPPGTRLAAWLDSQRHFHGEYLRPLVAPFTALVAAVDAGDGVESSAAAGLPDGAARPEAVAVRLRRDGVPTLWAEPVSVRSAHDVEELCRSRGRSSIDLLRADPSLATELQIGSWFQAAWKGRLVRRALLRTRFVASLLRGVVRNPATFRIAADVAFWSGVRSAATKAEWSRLTRSSYVTFCYHRLAGELRPGEEQLDVPPRQLRRQVRTLRLLGYRPLRVEDVIAFHAGELPTLPRRSYLLTADDAYVDAVRTLQQVAAALPIVFVITEVSAGRPARVSEILAPEIPQAPIADWELLRGASGAGVAIGSHSRRHSSLTKLKPPDLEDELTGARTDIARAGVPEAPLLAYPYGRHDEKVRQAAIEAGYALAFTTQVGRNGAGTDRWCLHRVGIHARDGLAAFLWKAVTGEPAPEPWERWQLRREPRRIARLRRGAAEGAAG